MGHLESKTKSQELKIEKILLTLVAAVLNQVSLEIIRKVVFS
jgi:hypothetical protein